MRDIKDLRTGLENLKDHCDESGDSLQRDINSLGHEFDDVKKSAETLIDTCEKINDNVAKLLDIVRMLADRIDRLEKKHEGHSHQQDDVCGPDTSYTGVAIDPTYIKPLVESETT